MEKVVGVPLRTPLGPNGLPGTPPLVCGFPPGALPGVIVGVVVVVEGVVEVVFVFVCAVVVVPVVATGGAAAEGWVTLTVVLADALAPSAVVNTTCKV